MIQEQQNGELNAQALERHLSHCASCRREFEAWRRLTHLIADDETPEPPAAYFQAMQSSVLRQIRSQSVARERRAAWWQSLLRPAFAPGIAIVTAFVCGIVIGRVSAVSQPAPVESERKIAQAPMPERDLRPLPNQIQERKPEPSLEEGNRSAKTERDLRPLLNQIQKSKSASRVSAALNRQRKSVPQRGKAAPPQPSEKPSPHSVGGYAIYALDAPPLTLASSADSVVLSGTETDMNSDDTTWGEIVAPVHQQIVVPLNNVCTDPQSASSSESSSKTEESKGAPII
jgi:hypothetical protein